MTPELVDRPLERRTEKSDLRDAAEGDLPQFEWSEGMQRNSREMSAPAARRTLGFRRTTMRVMHRKSQGIVAVYEQDPTVTEAGTRTLVFESSAACTRLQEFPQDWHRLSDEALIALQRLPS